MFTASSWGLRWLRFLLLALLFLGDIAVSCGEEIRANHRLLFSAQPTAREISEARIFDEPLLPVEENPAAGENLALSQALVAYSSRTNLDDFSSLTDFLDRYPQSAWAASLRLHLGVEYYNFGYYSRALEVWEEAWKEFEHSTRAQTKAQADRALGELARMYSKLGRMRELEELLAVTQHRPLSGPGTQLIGAAREGLWMMQNRPEVSFRCGPLALDRILAYGDPMKAAHPLIAQSKSTTNGFSLAQVGELSQRIGLNYQAAFRTSGAAIILPAVIHWNVGHYAALLERKGDRFLVQDSTFRGSVWMTPTALDAESSGYFLVPTGPMPEGWRAVGEAEARKVWGKGMTTSSDPDGTTDQYDAENGGTCSGMGMTTYSMQTMLVGLALSDTPVGYRPPVGPPVYFSAHYHQKEANQPATFSYSNLGHKWTCTWIAYITDNPQSPNADVSYYVDGGGTVPFSDINTNTHIYALQYLSQALLIKTSSLSYEMQFPDGSKKEFAQSDGSTGTSRRVFLTQMIDPAGNTVQLNYDSMLRITNIVDAIGQPTSLSYTNTNSPYAITAVTDPFQRTAYLQYNSSGLLSQITDVLGLTSQYVYDTNDFVTALTTPYGTTVFTNGAANGVQWLEATDPLGESELLATTQKGVISGSDPATILPRGMGTCNAYLYDRNSFYWNKKAFADAPWDYTQAKIYHFLHESDISIRSRVLESVKPALENRTWYNYPGQPTAYSGTAADYIGCAMLGTSGQPAASGRVLDDGTTQLRYYQYNAQGNVTNSIDPVGRTFSYIYATNNVDLLQVRMTHNGKNELQSSATYNSQHLPLTLTDASGQTTTNTYNARGQILSTSNPKGELTTFWYDTNGYLLTVTGHLQTTNDVTAFTYDGFGRVQTVTDTEGYTLTFAYDVLDRKTSVTHPDGTFEQYVYSNLDLVASCDRLGRWTTNTYNADRQLVQVQDPLLRVTSYDWCKCGAMTGLTDPMGRTTTWDYDVESRPIAKNYVDGSTVTYVYENSTSRLQSEYEEDGELKFYEYCADDNLAQVSYPNANIATPTVSYTYDPDYNRLLTMQDGIGTTVYTYNAITPVPALGAGLLASVSGPLPNSLVTYQYDSLGRVASRAINGMAQAITYDVLDRPSIITNVLGTFQYSYVDATSRLLSESYPNGQTNLYSYYNDVGDERLLQIQHLKANGSLLSGFGYGYNAVGQITAWTNQWDTIATRVWIPAYDAADQLTNIVSTGGPSPVTNYAYAYDLAGNRLVAGTNGIQDSFSYNPLNQLIVSTGLTNAATYEWDGENRLTAINNGIHRSEFFYDGSGRRVEIIELTNGVVMTNNYYLWCGNDICEVRDSTGANTLRRLFAQGEQVSGQNYYYTRDHLGSVREALDTNGATSTRYDYDPYGQQSAIQQNLKTTFAYTGHFIHSPSRLYLTLYRALDSTTGRWLSRDPIGIMGSANLYAYVDSDPIDKIDLFGLADYCTENDSENGKGFGNEIQNALGFILLGLATEGIGDVALGAGEVGYESQEATQLYRVFGDDATGLGNYYTTVNPATVADFRTTAGLYPGNSGSFVLEGTLNNTEGVTFGNAASGPGGIGGGLPQVIVPNPETQITIQRVSGVNPPF